MSLDREVTLDSIDIRTIPLNWAAIARLGRSVNELKDEPLHIQEFGPLRDLTEPLYPVIPMVASVIANRRNPEVTILYPTEEQVKAMRPGLGLASTVIGRFSANWQARFDRFLERKGANKVMGVAEKAFGIIDVVETTHYDQPRQRFIEGLALMYSDLSQPETEAGGFLGLEEVGRPIEHKISQLIEEVRADQFGHGRGRYFNSNRHPFLSKLLVAVNSVGINFPKEPEETFFGPNSDQKAATAGSEIMGGIETFLRGNGRRVPPASRPMKFELFNRDSYMRVVAEWFGSDKLERVKAHLPEVLNQTVDCIPENPSAVATRIYEIAEDIVTLKKQDKTDREIAEALINNWLITGLRVKLMLGLRAKELQEI